MADITQNLDIRVRATEEASGTFAKAGEKYEEFLHKLKKSGGRRGLLAETGELFEGKGALVGLSLIGNQVKEAAEKFEKLNEEFSSGKKTTGEMVEGIAKGLPILGAWIEAGRTIRGVIDGTGEETAEIEEENKRINELLAFRKKELLEEKQAHEEILATIKKIRDERALLVAGPQEKPALAIEQSLGLDRETAEKLKKKAEESINEKYADSIKAAQNAASSAAMKVGDKGREAEEAKRYAESRSGGLIGFVTENSIDQAAAEKASAEADAAARRSAGLAKASANLVKERDAAIEAAKKDLDDRLEEQEKLAGGKLNDIRLQQYREREADAADSAEKIAAVESRTKEKQFRDAKLFLSADLEAARQAHAEKVEEIEKAARAAQLKDPEAFGDINARAQAAQAAELASFSTAKEKAHQDETERQADVAARVRQAQLADLEAQVSAGDKAKQGEAEKLRIADQYADRQRELVKLAKEADETQRRQINGMIAGLAAQEKSVQAEAAKTRSLATQDVLDSAREQSLRQREQLGDRAAGIELKRVEIAKQFRDEQKRLNEIIADPTASLAQRQAARDRANELAKTSQAAIDRAGGGGFHLTGGFDAGSGAGNAFGSGSALASRERAGIFSHTFKSIPDATSKEEQKQTGLLGMILSAIQASTKVAPQPVGINLRW